MTSDWAKQEGTLEHGGTVYDTYQHSDGSTVHLEQEMMLRITSGG